MRVVIGWIIAGTLLAISVLGAVPAQNILGVATWMVIGVAVAAGLGVLITSVEPVPKRDGKGLLLSILRSALPVAVGVITLLSTAAAGCDDEGGAPSQERCHTWLGNPTVDWPGAPLFALALSLGVGYLVWRLLGRVFHWWEGRLGC